MSVWFAIPSIRPAHEAMTCLAMWQGKGYKVAVFRDRGAEALPVDLCVHGDYVSYPHAVNLLAKRILGMDREAEWIVTGGDDILPDLSNDADVIAKQCRIFFKGTLGIMQPTGDRHMEDGQGRCAAERVCVCPWMGREWCERGYEGNGPMCEDYFHFYVDEDLHCVAEKHDILWHRRDLTQHHAWWGRTGNQRPDHLNRASLQSQEAKRIFETRKAADFPGSGLK